jgi:beta-glucosidase
VPVSSDAGGGGLPTVDAGGPPGSGPLDAAVDSRNGASSDAAQLIDGRSVTPPRDAGSVETSLAANDASTDGQSQPTDAGTDGQSQPADAGTDGQSDSAIGTEGGADTGQPCVSDPTQFTYPFQDYCLSLEDRVTNLLSLLTDTEAVSLLTEHQPAITRLGIEAFSTYTEGIHGLGSAQNEPTMTLLATQFPQASGLGETWDPEMTRQVGAEEGHEARVYYVKYNGTHASLAIRAPVVDLNRDPRAGRNEESMGEDPYLVGEMTKGYVHGLQGDDPTYLQSASTAKHFLAYNQEENRGDLNVVVDDRNLREYYLIPFREVLQTQHGQSFMTSYNAVNGVPNTVSPYIQSIVIGEWGFDGMVCTDADAMQATYESYHYFPSLIAAAAGTVIAGTPVILAGDATAMQSAFSTGALARAEVDAALRGNFRMRFRLGEFDPPARVSYSTVDGNSTPWNDAATQATARLVTQKSIVLLKNSSGTLPLDKTTVKNLAVIGPNANQVFGDWYGGKPPYAVTPLAGITSKVGTGVNVQFALDNTNGDAVTIATGADAAIVLVGNNPICGTMTWATCPSPYDSKEAVDRQYIDLKPDQLALIQAVFAVNPNTIVVLVSSFAQSITWVNANIPAIVHVTHSSQELGNGLADVLFGDYNPGGRTTVTWYNALTDIPAKTDYNIRNGRTYMYFTGTPIYPFGYGLSYTTFGYSSLTLSASSVTPTGSITASVDVTNTGTMTGDEVVQLYVSYPTVAGLALPIKRLIGFQRVTLAPQASQTVVFTISESSVSTWNDTASAYQVPSSTVHLTVGGSSADTRAEGDLTIL